jgi:hypothetical protein
VRGSSSRTSGSLAGKGQDGWVAIDKTPTGKPHEKGQLCAIFGDMGNWRIPFKVENLGKSHRHRHPEAQRPRGFTVDEAYPHPTSQPTPGVMKLDYQTWMSWSRRYGIIALVGIDAAGQVLAEAHSGLTSTTWYEERSVRRRGPEVVAAKRILP